ncbi:MAG: DUF4097 domain-containing protein [Bacteroidetes bacterium]|nr:DUF4097 domain-containing protein [Bacteroidota bacterium]MBU1374155.1 DUF4097 domain-containing protein [Bacteroidota bacterium]MBU1484732.1 DUF4097 domain-containing protein [Bacteroidota bacterium]MBU1761857.1 DUF4097 domain-containing protein [Bacteroidota bacterium]MBU2046189.1 DUF4097 domain-containing protein [Bacteroidota bacterium]
MKKVYKAIILSLVLCLGISLLKAQEVPVPPKAPEKAEVPAPPAPPKFDEQAWKDWGENFKKSFDEKKWHEWGEKVEKSFKGFDKQFEGMNLASADFDKKLEKLNIKLKDLKIPAMPKIPALPPMPPMPEINIPSEVFINNGWTLGAPKDAVEKIKKLTKTYPVDANDQLLITTSYGKITVNTWDKNKIKVDVEIKAYADDEEDAQKLLDGVSISNSKGGNQISFKTNINSNNNNNNWLSSNFWGGNTKKQKVDVYYTVYMPVKNALNLKTNYTTNIIPDMQGDVTINMNYGDLTAGKLSAKTNIRSNYGKLTIDGVEDAIFSANYGTIKVAESNNIDANLNYCGADLGKLSGNATLKMNYSGGLKITSFDKDFKSLNINSNYSSINLDFNGNQAFNFNVTTNYASFKYDDNKVTITSKSPSDDEKGWSSTKNYKGYYGKSPSGNITIKSNYGGVKFN